METLANPLTWLKITLVWNFIRHLRGKPTICSTSREKLSVSTFVIGTAGFNLWFWPHWLRPKLESNRAATRR